jgi:hypothetical protein
MLTLSGVLFLEAFALLLKKSPMDTQWVFDHYHEKKGLK